MSNRHTCVDKLWQGGTPVSGVALIVVLITVSVIITGAGVHSSVVWLILAGVSILCLAFCSCVKCRKRASRWRRSSDQSDTISTISDGTDNFMNMMYPSALQEVPSLRRDSPPSYTTVMSPDQPPPPYSTLVHSLRAARASIVSIAEDNETPPPYSHIASTDNSVTQELRQNQSLTSEGDSISIISSGDITCGNKYVGDITVNCGVRTCDNQDRVNLNCEVEQTSTC